MRPRYALFALAAAIIVAIGALSVIAGGAGEPDPCPTPVPGTKEATLLERARREARFVLLYPCSLPAGQRLSAAAVVGEPGAQSVTFEFTGPFAMSFRQSQLSPVIGPEPIGTSRIPVQLFPGVAGELIERNDGTGDFLYVVTWNRDGVFYELRATGPSQSRRQILLVVQSLI